MSVWLYPNLNYLLEIKTECGQRGLSFMIRLAITWFWGLSHTYIISYRNVIIIIPVDVKQNYITPGGHIFLYISMFPVEIHIVCIDFGCRDGVEWGFAKICLFCVKYVIMWDNWWWSINSAGSCSSLNPGAECSSRNPLNDMNSWGGGRDSGELIILSLELSLSRLL